MIAAKTAMRIDLTALVVTLMNDSPALLRLAGSNDVIADILPWGPFDANTHDTLEAAVRVLLKTQTGSHAGKVEQLYASVGKVDPGTQNFNLTIGYLALTTNSSEQNSQLENSGARWKNWYAFLPWEDWRNDRPTLLDKVIKPALNHWANTEGAYATSEQQESSTNRINAAFGFDGGPWRVSAAVERIDLLHEAGLLAECAPVKNRQIAPLGVAMADGQRRMLAVAIGKMREKIRHIPVVPGLMAGEFTLTQLQKCAEGILGQALHKQNFRRQIDNLGLVEKTGGNSRTTGGRPASLYRFSAGRN